MQVKSALDSERIFSALALLKVDPERWRTVEATLRRDLATEIAIYLWYPLREDICATLKDSGAPDARRLGEAWEPLLGG